MANGVANLEVLLLVKFSFVGWDRVTREKRNHVVRKAVRDSLLFERFKEFRRQVRKWSVVVRIKDVLVVAQVVARVAVAALVDILGVVGVALLLGAAVDRLLNQLPSEVVC